MIKNNLLSEFKTIVKGFGDTLVIFRNLLQDRRIAKQNFSQAALAKDFLGDNYTTIGAHNAMNDVKTLNNLIKEIGVDAATFRNEGKSLNTIMKAQELSAVRN